MNITGLNERFEFYASRHKDLNHTPGAGYPSFLECDIEELQQAVLDGLKFPCMLLQTPEFSKQGDTDNPSESVDAFFWILMPRGDSKKSEIYQKTKDIADQITNMMIADSEEYFDGGLIKTAEGRLGPLTDGLYGWGVSFSFDQPYNGAVNPAKWNL